MELNLTDYQNITPPGRRDNSAKRRVTVMWTNCGPYHYARLRALNKLFDVQVLQYYDQEGSRGWADPTSHVEFPVRTLFPRQGQRAGAGALVRTVWREMRSARPDVVLVPGYTDPGALAMAVWAKLHGVPAVLMSASTALDRPRSWLKEWTKRRIVSGLFRAAIVAGARTGAYVQSLGIEAERVGYCNNIVENAFFSEGAASWRNGQSTARGELPDRYFLYVGRLSEEKNLVALLSAFRQYRQAGGGWSLVIVGGGPQEDKLRALCADIDGVVLAGRRGPGELVRIYALAGSFVLPSLSEPWGLVVNEAMAAGLPVIVSDRCGCVDDLVEHGGNGWIIDPNDTKNLIARMLQMENLSVAERQKMARRSEEIIRNFSPERYGQEVKRLVEDLLS